jgi:hypothetical protein
MTLASEQLQFVQHQLNYHFRDIGRLVLCFRAAHWSDFDGVADDGNRKFAKTGVTISTNVTTTVNVIHQTVISNSTSAGALTNPTASVATVRVTILEQHTRLRNPTHEIMCIARDMIPYQTSLFGKMSAPAFMSGAFKNSQPASRLFISAMLR